MEGQREEESGSDGPGQFLRGDVQSRDGVRRHPKPVGSDTGV